jgi:hypothetical protein
MTQPPSQSQGLERSGGADEKRIAPRIDPRKHLLKLVMRAARVAPRAIWALHLEGSHYWAAAIATARSAAGCPFPFANFVAPHR